MPDNPLLPLFPVKEPTTMQWQVRWKAILDQLLKNSNKPASNLDKTYLRLDGGNSPTTFINWKNQGLLDVGELTLQDIAGGPTLALLTSNPFTPTTLPSPTVLSSGTSAISVLPLIPITPAPANPIVLETLLVQITDTTTTVINGTYKNSVTFPDFAPTATFEFQNKPIGSGGAFDLDSYDVIVATCDRFTYTGGHLLTVDSQILGTTGIVEVFDISTGLGFVVPSGQAIRIHIFIQARMAA